MVELGIYLKMKTPPNKFVAHQDKDPILKTETPSKSPFDISIIEWSSLGTRSVVETLAAQSCVLVGDAFILNQQLCSPVMLSLINNA